MVFSTLHGTTNDLSLDLKRLVSKKYNPRLRGELPASNKIINCREIIRAAFKENPISLTNYEGGAIVSEYAKLTALPERLDIDTLLNWEEAELKGKANNPNALKEMLLLLDPKSIAKRVGLDALIWANSMSEDYPQFRYGWHRDFLSQYDHSTARLKIAARALRQLKTAGSDTRVGLKTYELMRFFGENVSLQSYVQDIKSCLREGRDINLDNLLRFSLEGVAIKAGSSALGNNHKYGYVPREVKVGGIFYNFFMDAPAALVLRYDQNPVAVVSFFAISPDRVLINQLQTVAPRKLIREESYRDLEVETLEVNRWELEPLDWKRFLVTTVAKLVKTQGFSELGIQSAKNNRWVNQEGHLSSERAREIYDKFASQLNMKKDKSDDFYSEISRLIKG